ncbi:SOS response-associated peptidase family protein [Rhodanobacter denitrificans]|uniref:Abasic site processing protein n=1 Tax=Rhodanobacter denitrificans TaxID=666685 RepID=M4NDE7_9GAMM|nr:SOS response-associated peptidase family protein [Rhodanobacter denitrificans]AGG88785.1 hypothetical protein R2APBS1_1653 [Rhodanobacter denitrificans]UJJ58548.1 SOS response-associated peptidase family protein [Rhodanobacter denitrificans]UJM87917.1 SOS response-associated peptidase family protein [Rhodanobacter denitrificans]
MCYSAQIWADYRKFERLGGKLSIAEYTKLAGWTKKKGNWTKVVPKVMRRSMLEASSLSPELADEAASADAQGITLLLDEIAALEKRQAEAKEKLASPKPTKKAENDLRVSTNKIAAAKKKLEEIRSPAPSGGIDRIWPGQFAPILIRDPETGERVVIPMRYRCRLPGWDVAKETEKPGTYNARRDKLTTVWKKVFGVHHGIMVVERFYESVNLHDLQHRDLVPGEREQSVEIVFTPQTGEDLFVACLWTYTEGSGDEPGFFSFAAITDEPPPEVSDAGHDRCIVTVAEENIDAWLNPTASTPVVLNALLDAADRPYFEHELAGAMKATE